MSNTEEFTVYFPDYEGDYWEARYTTAVITAADMLGLCSEHAEENVSYKIEFRKKDNGTTDLRVKFSYKDNDDYCGDDDDDDPAGVYSPVISPTPFPPASFSLSEPLDALFTAYANDLPVFLIPV